MERLTAAKLVGCFQLMTDSNKKEQRMAPLMPIPTMLTVFFATAELKYFQTEVFNAMPKLSLPAKIHSLLSSIAYLRLARETLRILF
jgi:hypothetical protein